MRSVAISLMLIAGLLAGCADEAAGPADDQEEQVFNDLETKATEKTGVIRGIVIDPAIVPVEGVTIKVLNTEMEATTNADGAFAFSNVEPGTYFLKASKPGFSTVQQSTPVEAGVDKPPIVKIQMLPDASSAPFVQPFTFNGFIQCSWTLPVVALAMCSVPEIVGIDLGDDFLTSMDTNGYPTFVQAEQVWESTQTAGDALSLSFWDGTTSAPRGVRGVSPLMTNGDQEFLINGTGGSKSGRSPMNQPGEQVSFRTFAAGYPGTDCLPTGQCTWGVGVTVEQPFDVFTHIFYNAMPAEGWWFINDGPPQV